MVLVLFAISIAFFVSASAGLGGSLVLVPVLTLALGAKAGVSLTALLLAGNNIVKLWAYRRTLPLRAAVAVTLCTLVGAGIGARLLVVLSEQWAQAIVVFSLASALLAERREVRALGGALAPTLAVMSGAMSGVSGTSGPLKGVAVRALGLDRMHTIGAAAVVSAAADLTKTTVFAEAGLLGRAELQLALLSIPLMIAATYAGRQFAITIGEKGFARLFWIVIGGYTVRLML
jgi:uncharacterized membrane protein YfcA